MILDFYDVGVLYDAKSQLICNVVDGHDYDTNYLVSEKNRTPLRYSGTTSPKQNDYQ